MTGLIKSQRTVRRTGALVLLLAVLAVFIQPIPASAAVGDEWPLTPETTPVQIEPGGLYGSSGNQIFQFTGVQSGQAGSKVIAQTAPGAPNYWSANLGLGRDAAGNLQFVGSRYNTSFPALYALKDGASTMTEIGAAPQASAAWGGLSVAPDGAVWQGTNLQSTGSSRVSRFDPSTGIGVISGPLSSTVSGDPVWNGGGVVAPDYAFDSVGNLFGLAFNAGQGWIYRYNGDSFSAAGMTVTPWLPISGPALSAGSANYGFAWHAGSWYSGNANGTLYRIDASTGVSTVAGRVTSAATFDYRLTDLASADLVPGPQLTVTKTANRATVDPGGVVRFELTATNTGPAAFEADFTDELAEVLDEADDNGDASADIGSVDLSGNQLFWRGVLQPGQRATIKFSVTVKSAVPGDHQLVNRVTSSVPNAILPPPVLVDISGFVLAKSVNRTVAAPGDSVAYTVVGTNIGRTPLFAEFSDDLRDVIDDADFRGDVDASTGRVLSGSGTVRWTGRLLPGQSVTVSYQVVVRQAGGNGIMRNSVTSNTAGNQQTKPVQTTVRELPSSTSVQPPAPDIKPKIPGVPREPNTSDQLAKTGVEASLLSLPALLLLLLGLSLVVLSRVQRSGGQR